MLSIEKCYEVLNKKGKKYTQQEAKAIREYLYEFAEVVHQIKKIEDESFFTGKNSDTL